MPNICQLGGDKMKTLEAYDRAVIVRDYLKLMWNVYENIEGTTLDELSVLRLGIQTFYEKIEEEVEGIIKALDRNESESEEDDD